VNKTLELSEISHSEWLSLNQFFHEIKQIDSQCVSVYYPYGKGDETISLLRETKRREPFEKIELKIEKTIKQLKENPWENISKKYNVGDTFETQVVNKVDFGIFVKIFDEIDGMIHISDLSWNEKENNNILNSLKKGDKIKVKILEINTEKERVSLSVKHLIEDPVQDYISKNPVKSIVSGKIISVDEKEITVNLAENINGFIKKVNLSKNKTEQKIDRFAEGEVLDSMIISYDNKIRKINLSVKDKEIEEENKTLSEYGSSDSGASLGDILGDALNKKSNK